MSGMRATGDGFGERNALVRPPDEEQARLLEILMEADGGPVSFDELRARGIENPATLAYELEIAGLSIELVHGRQASGLSLQPGVRLRSTSLGTIALGGEPERARDRRDAPDRARDRRDAPDRARDRGRAPDRARDRGREQPDAAPGAGAQQPEAQPGVREGKPRVPEARPGARRERLTAWPGVRDWKPAALVAALALAGLVIVLNSALAPSSPQRGGDHLRLAQSRARRSDGAGSRHGQAKSARAHASAAAGSASQNAQAADTAEAAEAPVAGDQREPPAHHGAPAPTSWRTQARAGGASAPGPDASRAQPPQTTSQADTTRPSSGQGTSGEQRPSAGQHDGSEQKPGSGAGPRQAPSAGTTPAGEHQAPSTGTTPAGEHPSPAARTTPTGEHAPSGGRPEQTGGKEATGGEEAP
jgi:hypothetical protein